MNVPNWLLMTSNVYQWIVKIIYLHLIYPNNISRMNEYRLEFENDDRYVVEIIINKKKYTCTLWLNNNSIYKFDFIDPIDFTSKLCDSDNTKVETFIDLLIDQTGFNVILLRNKKRKTTRKIMNMDMDMDIQMEMTA